MPDFILFQRDNGDEYRLKITAADAVELEKRLDCSINEAVAKFDRVSVASDLFAATLPSEMPYKDRKNIALSVFDEMISSGKNIQDYQIVIMDALVASGFMNGEIVALQKEMMKKTKTILAANSTESQT